MKCYLCAGAKFTTRKGVVRDDPSMTVLECATCRLVTLSSLDHIREGHYEHSGMHGASLPTIESWLRDCESDDQRRFEMLRAELVNSNVLDFGCGAAGFLVKARTLARDVVGVEPELRVREFWADRLSVYPSLDNVSGTYDLITAFHVVEHLSDPRGMLQTLATRLSGAGRIVVEVPSADDALLTLFDCDAFQQFTYWSQHLFLFTAESLQRLATQAGLRVISVQQYQRYPLSNHLYWLSRELPGGHRHWGFLDSQALRDAYAAALSQIGKCDTLIAYLDRPPE